MYYLLDTPSNKWVYGTSFIGEETLSFSEPDVKLSSEWQTTALTHTHTHRHREYVSLDDHHTNTDLNVPSHVTTHMSCSPSDPLGMNLTESMMVPRLLIESGFKLHCEVEKIKRKAEEEIMKEKSEEEKEASRKCRSRERSELRKPLVDIHSMSFSFPSALTETHKGLLLLRLVFSLVCHVYYYIKM